MGKSSVKTLLSDHTLMYNDLRRVNCYYYIVVAEA